MFCIVFKRFCFTFKVVSVYEHISYVLLYLLACYIFYLHLNCASNFSYLYDCTGFSVFVCISVLLPHNEGEYPFTKIFGLVKGMKECNIFFF